MVRELIGLCGAAAERCLHDCLLGVVTSTVAALFTAVSLGFATFAAYVHLCVSEGPVAAALIVSGDLWADRNRHLGNRSCAPACRPVAPRGGGLITPKCRCADQSLAAAGAPQDQLALIGAMRLGRELSTMQLVALTLAAGFMAGRKLHK